MSKENLMAFFEHVRSDSILLERMASITEAKEAVKVAKNAGHDITEGDIIRFNAKITAELSDSELENVSGGAWGMFLLKEAAKVAGAFLVAGGATIGVTKLIDTI